jgi:hypothetical protein
MKLMAMMRKKAALLKKRMAILNALISSGWCHGGHRADSLLVGLYFVKLFDYFL